MRSTKPVLALIAILASSDAGAALPEADSFNEELIVAHYADHRFPVASPGSLIRQQPFPGAHPQLGSRKDQVDDHHLAGSFGWTFAWVPAHEVPGGNQAIAEWRKAEAERSKLECLEGSCIIITVVQPRESKEPADLGACRVPIVAEVEGAPVNCTPLVRTLDGTRYVRVVTGTTTVYYMMGEPDYNLKVYLPQSDHETLVRTAVVRALSLDPLSLKTNLGTTYVIGAARFRPSPLLSGKFDTATVRVDYDLSKRNSKVWQIQAVVSTTIYVSSRNTDRMSDWHLPSNQEEQFYLDTIRNAIITQVKQSCDTSATIDSYSITCGMGPSIGDETGYVSSVDFMYSPDRNKWE